ncbi:hypothetical protein BDQ17DRAFT_1417486 [Cyathus striatus]|nr:hypothetical protein BDQ17DRAFT_1417486 [Cyathus striatus]
MMHEGEQVRQLRQEINDAKQEGDRWRARCEMLEREATGAADKTEDAADAAGPSDANPDRKKTITSAGTGKDSARVTAARPRTRTCSARRRKVSSLHRGQKTANSGSRGLTTSFFVFLPALYDFIMF